MSVRTWTCGNGHTFTHGNEVWHYDLSQGTLDDGSPIPMYCTEAFSETDRDLGQYEGEPCMDSSSLIYD